MEEDIKNIEEMLEFKEDIIKYHAWVGTKLINSVENLLTRYKQLEQENKELQESHDYIYEAYQDAGKKMFEYAEENEKLCDINRKLEQENNNYKAAALKNDDYYKEVCNKNKELEEENKELLEVRLSANAHNRIMELEKELRIAKDTIETKDIEAYGSIPKSKAKELLKKYELYKKETNITLLRTTFESKIEVLQELLRRGEIR